MKSDVVWMLVVRFPGDYGTRAEVAERAGTNQTDPVRLFPDRRRMHQLLLSCDRVRVCACVCV